MSAWFPMSLILTATTACIYLKTAGFPYASASSLCMDIYTDVQSKEHWKQQFQTALNKGLTATISSNNLLTGSKMIELNDQPSVFAQAATAYRLCRRYRHRYTRRRFGRFTGQIVGFAGHLGKLPLDKTVSGLNASLAELKSTLQSAISR